MVKNIIKDRKIVADNWLTIEEDNLPSDNDTNIIVSFNLWQQQRNTLLERNGKLGLIIGDGVAIESIVDDLNYFDMIAIQFAKFADGRGYSYARLLRERYHYTQEIRAIGDVLRDQMYYMQRCGINAFEMPPETNIEKALLGFNDFTVTYQPAADGSASSSEY